MLRSTNLLQGAGDLWVALTTPRRYRSSSSDALQGSVTACLDATRAVVRLEGPHTIQFLQGMLTNDVRPLETPGAAPVYAALLTPKGKFLHDVILYRHPDNALLMDVDSRGKLRALDWLARYKLRKQVQLHDVSHEQSVYVRFGPGTPTEQEGWSLDPRLSSLGLRTVQPHGRINISSSSGVSSSSTSAREENPGSSASDPAMQYRTWRHMHGVAEGEVEIPTDDDRSPVQGESVMTEAGEPAGTVQGVSSGYGLLYARLKPALAASEGQTILRGKQSGIRLLPVRPEWWDETWGREEAGEGANGEDK